MTLTQQSMKAFSIYKVKELYFAALKTDVQLEFHLVFLKGDCTCRVRASQTQTMA